MLLEKPNLLEEDPIVWAHIKNERKRQENTIELIASENFTSPAVMEAMGSILTNKYAEGYPGKRYYGGCTNVDEIEKLAINRVKELFGMDYANVQPHSGAQANLAVYQALLKPGDTVLAMSLQNGGHLTHGSSVNQSGKLYNFIDYGVKEDGYINYKELRELCYQYRPRLVLAGASAYPRKIDFKKIREIVDEVNESIYWEIEGLSKILSENKENYILEEYEKSQIYFMVDMAHIAGLVAAGLHQNPCEYADVVTSTTHKTLRGPRGGIILAKAEFGKKINSAVFPGTQGGPLEHVIAAKAVCFKEASTQEFKEYQKQIIINCKVLADTLIEHGFNLVTGGTDNHLILVDLRNKGITGIEAQERLEKVGITANKNAVPNDNEKPSVTSGIRLGTAAVTTRGMKEEEMIKIGQAIAITLDRDSYSHISLDSIKLKMKELCEQHPIY